MSYREKQALIQIISTLGLYTAYLIYILTTSQPLIDNIQRAAIVMLIFIGISIVAIIIIQVIFHIFLAMATEIKREIDVHKGIPKTDKEPSYEFDEPSDELSHLVNLKSSRNAYIIAGIGVMAAILSAALGFNPFYMLQIIFASYLFANVFEYSSQLFYYKKGVRNG